MRHDLVKELVTQHNHIFEVRREYGRIQRALVPDLSFAEEIEPSALHHLRFRCECVGTEKNGSAEDPFERSDQSSILLSTFTHAENLEHVGSGFKSDDLAFLLNRQCG